LYKDIRTFYVDQRRDNKLCQNSIYVHFGRMLIAGAIIMLSVMFVTTLVNRTS
jgi:hypothetical protein